MIFYALIEQDYTLMLYDNFKFGQNHFQDEGSNNLIF